MDNKIIIPRLTIKHFRVPVIERIEPATETEPEEKILDYAPVDFNEYLVKEEEIDTTELTQEKNPTDIQIFITKKANELKEFNQNQLRMVKLDPSITTVIKKVLCK